MGKKFILGALASLALAACGTGQGNVPRQVPVDSTGLGKIQSSPLPPIRIEGLPGYGNFLEHFPDTRPWKDWAFEPQHILLYEDAVHAPDRAMLNQVLAANFVEIPKDYVGFLDLRVLEDSRKPWSEQNNHYPNPAEIFTFHAYGKVKHPGFWVVGYFARNVAYSELYTFQHAFILATYSTEGKPIDAFAWWWVEDDVYQLWDQVALAGDTLLEGYNSKGTEGVLKSVYRKTIITPKGKFKTVFKDYPKNEM